MKRILQQYHKDRWQMQGNFGNLRRIALGLGNGHYERVKKLEEEMIAANKARYEKSKEAEKR